MSFNKQSLFPLIFIVLHIISYGTFFLIANQNSFSPWLHEKKIGISNLVWFNSTFWPNWAGLFVIYELLYRRRCYSLSFCYLIALFLENFFIGADYMGSYDGLPLANVSFSFFSRKLSFLGASGGNAVNHFSIWLALIHFIAIILKIMWRRDDSVGRYLSSK
jgi:hypothetical protein